MDALQVEKRGYLLEKFRLFHLDTALTEDTAFHFHDFHKIVFFLDGTGSYCVEGKQYVLKPDDVVLVRQGTIHKALIDPDCRYERIILYIDPEYLKQRSTEQTQLDLCFEEAAKRKSYVLRPDPVQRDKLMQTLLTLKSMIGGKGYGDDVYAEISLAQLLIDLGRGRRTEHYSFTSAQNKGDKIVSLIEYINDHLTENITIDSLSEQLFLSKYYLMRMFRECTGYTIHSYITEKRMYLARELITDGVSVSEACYGCGYQDYSAFARAYKKCFGRSPSLEPEAKT